MNLTNFDYNPGQKVMDFSKLEDIFLRFVENKGEVDFEIMMLETTSSYLTSHRG